MTKLISLGFSCQSRFLLNCISDDSPSMPFDWIITTKKFILSELLAKDGSGFCKDVSELEMHVMPGEKIEGLGKDGIWFWHDFPRTADEKYLRADYRDHNDLSGKYRYLWARFIAAITDNSERKQFIVSNSQANLVEYASSDEDFQEKFRIDSEYVRALRAGLDSLGVQNYEVTYLVRSMEEYIELTSDQANFELDIRFVGPLSLPLKPIAAAAMVAGKTNDKSIASLLGRYDSGLEIVQSSSSCAIVLNEDKKPLAVVKMSPDCLTFCFSGGVDSVVIARNDGDNIYFPSGASWRKTSAKQRLRRL